MGEGNIFTLNQRVSDLEKRQEVDDFRMVSMESKIDNINLTVEKIHGKVETIQKTHYREAGAKEMTAKWTPWIISIVSVAVAVYAAVN